MEGMSRVNKYKDLRDQITEGKEIDRVNSGSVELESQLNERASRINKQEIEGFTLNPVSDHVERSSRKIEIIEDDEFTEGLSLSSDDLSDENMDKALSRVKESDNDSVSFNTRLDILNSIKLSTMADIKEAVKEESKSEEKKEETKTVTEKSLKEETSQEEKPVQENAGEDNSDGEDFLASLAQIIKGEELKKKESSNETDLESQKGAPEEKKEEKKEESKAEDEFEDLFSEPIDGPEEDEDEEELDPKAQKKAEKAAAKAKKKAEKEARKKAKLEAKAQEEEEEYEEEYDEQKTSIFEKILTFLCVVMLICLFAIIAYIVKTVFFN